MSKMALCFLWHTDETDKTDDNGSFYLLVIREKENLIRCHLLDPFHLCGIEIERSLI